MLFTLQRYEFFSKSQPASSICSLGLGCCLPYKGTNFSANHNCPRETVAAFRDVVYPTKVRIFQQITTRYAVLMNLKGMLFTLQRYEFFSKSQLSAIWVHKEKRCCLPYKGTNFSANHNTEQTAKVRYDDVVYPTKVRIFQQITTMFLLSIGLLTMLFTLQRYEFFSKSQPASSIASPSFWCCLPYKGTNSSANHNNTPLLA